MDDDEAVRRALRRLVASAGYEVLEYSGGREFIASLTIVRPACLVLDLHMPQDDGFSVLEQLTTEQSRFPVLVITGNDSSETRRRAAELGAAAYFRKPIDGEQLIGAIQRSVR